MFILFYLLSASLACSPNQEKQSIYIDPSLKGKVKKIILTIEGEAKDEAYLSRSVKEYSLDKELLRAEVLQNPGDSEVIFIREFFHKYDESLRLKSVIVNYKHNGIKSKGSINYIYPEDGLVIGKELRRANNGTSVKSTKHFIKNGLVIASESNEEGFSIGSNSIIRMNHEYDKAKNLILEKFEFESEDAEPNIQSNETRISLSEFDKQGNWVKANLLTLDHKGQEERTQAKREIEYY